MKRIGKRLCKAWSKRAESIIDAMERACNSQEPIYFQKLNSGLKPIPSTYEKGVFEIIPTERKYAYQLTKHPLAKECRIGRLNYRGFDKDHYFVGMRLDVPGTEKINNRWMPTQLSTIDFIFKHLGVNKDSYICDSGGGDGRVALTAPCKSVSLEHNETLVDIANRWAVHFDKKDVEIRKSNGYNDDYSGYTHIFISLTYQYPSNLAYTLAKQISRDTKVFSVEYPLEPLFKVEKIIPIVLNDTQIFPITYGFIQKLSPGVIKKKTN